MAPVTIVEADDALWADYNALATRAYGHQVPDITHLASHADRRVALREGRVIAGGMGLLVPQYFGGRAVPAALLSCGSVAPEERGTQFTATMFEHRLRPLQEQGAVIATVWTASNRYGHRLGWQAPAPVYSWSLPTDELRHGFSDEGFEVSHGATAQTHRLQDELARQWNGTWQRPFWWQAWQQRRHPQAATYRFARQGRDLTGVLMVASEIDPAHGRVLSVHEFWARDHDTATAMLAFLSRQGARTTTLTFQRTALPPTPLLLHHLRRVNALQTRSWQPWMMRVLDPAAAVRARGWPEVEAELPLEIIEDPTQRHTLYLSAGHGVLEPSTRPGLVRLTPSQFAAWFAGAYRSPAAATMAGVRADPVTLAKLVALTCGQEPWLADYF